jgi:acyl-CoA thioester hydrolase
VERFERTFPLRWSDADANGHVRHTVYAELGVELRMAWLAEAGLTWRWFGEQGLGPVLLEERSEYLREVGIGEAVRVTLEAVGLSPDGGFWRLRHSVLRADGVEAARVTVYGGWMDLAARRLRPAPDALLARLRSAARAADFQELPPLKRRP